MKVGDFIQGIDKSYERSIYLIYDIVIDASPKKVYFVKCVQFEKRYVGHTYTFDENRVKEYEVIEVPKAFKLLYGVNNESVV